MDRLGHRRFEEDGRRIGVGDAGLSAVVLAVGALVGLCAPVGRFGCAWGSRGLPVASRGCERLERAWIRCWRLPAETDPPPPASKVVFL